MSRVCGPDAPKFHPDGHVPRKRGRPRLANSPGSIMASANRMLAFRLKNFTERMNAWDRRIDERREEGDPFNKQRLIVEGDLDYRR